MFLYSLYSKNIELIDVNSVTEQEMNLSQKNFSNQCEQTGRHTHMFHTLIKKENTQRNANISVQWVLWCSIYKFYML